MYGYRRMAREEEEEGGRGGEKGKQVEEWLDNFSRKFNGINTKRLLFFCFSLYIFIIIFSARANTGDAF